MGESAFAQQGAWQPFAGCEPPYSAVYAVRDEAGSDLFAAYRRELRAWYAPQRDLRLFDIRRSEEQPARAPQWLTWRELSTQELCRLSPTAQAWAAGFLPIDEVIPFVRN